MTAAAELARERIHVDGSGAPERRLHLAMAEVAEENRHSRSLNGARVLDDSVEILLAYAVLRQSACGHREPRQPERVIDAERRQDFAKQSHASRGGRCVNSNI